MKNDKINVKCSGCGGELVFSGSHQALFCANCGRVHKFEKKNNVIKLDFESEIYKNSNDFDAKNGKENVDINIQKNNENNKIQGEKSDVDSQSNKKENSENLNQSSTNSQINANSNENDVNLKINSVGMQDKKHEKINEKTHEKTPKKAKNCPNCGAKFEEKNQEITLSCPYCGTKFVKNQESFSGLKPNNIIPFAFDKKQAIEFYKQNVKRKRFLPNKFKKNPNVDSVEGTYISCFSFDSFTKSTYNGMLTKSVRTYYNGEWHNDTEMYHIKGNKDIQFDNIIVESSRFTDQKSFNEIKPFIINEETCYEYNKNFLRGYNVETYDNDPINCKKISEELMKVKIKNRILAGYDYDKVTYFKLSTTFENNKFSYILLPVYFINFKYKNKNYRTYLNGQTGAIGNDLPKSKTKITLLVLFGVLFFLLIFLLPMFLN